jgi:hypothetical protein
MYSNINKLTGIHRRNDKFCGTNRYKPSINDRPGFFNEISKWGCWRHAPETLL